jgi:ssDNA-binding replication factor A large subunit
MRDPWMAQKIAELGDYQKGLALEFILILHLDTNTTKDNDKVVTWLVGDETGTIEFSMWNCPLSIGDVISIVDGYTTQFQNKKRLFVSKAGGITRVRRFRKLFKVSEEHLDLCAKIL